MQIDPINIPVASVTFTVTKCIWLMVLTILGSVGLVGAYRVEPRNRRELKVQKQAERDDRQSGVAGGCDNISVGTTVLNSIRLATG
jgi:hypothetical protein